MYLNIAFPYLRPKQATYAREVFQGIIKDVIDAEDLDLEVNPRTVCAHSFNMRSLKLTFWSRFIA